MATPASAVEVQHRPPAIRGRAAQRLVRVHGVRVPDHLQHRLIGRGVRVGVGAREVVTLALGQLPDRLGLVLGVGVEGDLAGVTSVLDHHLGGDHPVRAEHVADRLDHLGAGRRDDHHVAAGRVVLLDQLHRLVEHQRVHDVVQGLGDDVLHRLHVPPGGERGKVLTHPLHLVVVGATDEVDELGVRTAQDGAPVDQPALVEGPAERQRAGLGDDRLVEVEEGGVAGHGGLLHAIRIGSRA
jgi:hypothetical protein